MGLFGIKWGQQRPEQKLDRTSTLFDAFGRLRTSTPDTIFDSKLSFGKLPTFWDELLAGNATSEHRETDSAVRMSVFGLGDYAVRQTRQRWNYQPGKSALGLMTFRLPTAIGLFASVGLCHGGYATPHKIHDGLSFEIENGIAYCCITKGSDTSGIVETRRIPQSQWNMDTLDGNGASGKVVDLTKAQILQLDYQWLGLGSVRFALEVDSVMVYIHEFQHAGIVESVYMHNGTQPIRYELRSLGGAGTMDQICSTIMSEGGRVRTGITTCVDTDGVLLSCPESSIRMLMAVRLNSNTPDAQVLIENIYTLNTANTSHRWVLLWNPTITGTTPNWVSAGSDSPMQVWRATSGTVLTGGMQLMSGYASRDSRQSNQTGEPSLGPGVSVSGVSDIFALGIESIGGASNCAGGISVRQLV